MKNNIISLVAILIGINTCLAKTVIQMEEKNGVFMVPCLVNGAKMKFVFDTGASNVSLSLPMAEYLFENDYISSDDLLEFGKTQLADGSIVDHLQINIKEIEIGGLKINNVKAFVLNSQSAPLLLGQSAIQQLGKIEIDGSSLVIYNGLFELTDSDIEYYIDLAARAEKEGNYAEAIAKYQILYDANVLSDAGIFAFARACDFSGNYSKAIPLLEELLESEYVDASSYNPGTASINLFTFLANNYAKMGLFNSMSVGYLEKALSLADSVNYEGTKSNPNIIRVC